MQYVTVFDVGNRAFSYWWFAAIGLAFVVLGLVLLWQRNRLFSMPAWLCWALVGTGSVWALGAFAFTQSGHHALHAALRNGQCEIVEGPVTQFDPMPYEGHKLESFVVDAKRFQYSDYVLLPGFRQTRSHGGPVRDGIQVRIHHQGNQIARLEIAKTDIDKTAMATGPSQ